MPKFNDFDLDVKVGTNSDDNGTKVTSVVACTPGTCYATCGGTSTLNTNCCIASALCSLSPKCRK